MESNVCKKALDSYTHFSPVVDVIVLPAVQNKTESCGGLPSSIWKCSKAN